MAYPIELCANASLATEVGMQVSVSLTCRLDGPETNVEALIAKAMAEVVQRHQDARNALAQAHVQKHLDTDEAEGHRCRDLCSSAQETALRALLSSVNKNEDEIMDEMQSRFGVGSFALLPASHASVWLLDLQRTAREKARGFSQTIT